MKSIVMYEAFSGKKFSEIGEDGVFLFMYCVFVCSTGMKITFDMFKSMYEGKKFRKWIDDEFDGIWKFYFQYNEFKAAKQNQNDQGSDSGKTATAVSMTDYANALIFDYGVSADYVMNKMDMWEIEPLFNGAAECMHSEMENKRLWTYIQMLPNMDSKKSKNMSPEKFLPFPWEKQAKENVAKKDLEKETERAKKIIGMSVSELLGKK